MYITNFLSKWIERDKLGWNKRCRTMEIRLSTFLFRSLEHGTVPFEGPVSCVLIESVKKKKKGTGRLLRMDQEGIYRDPEQERRGKNSIVSVDLQIT